MQVNNIKKRKTVNQVMFAIIMLLTLAAVIPLLGIIGYIFMKGYKAISWEFLVSLPTPAGDIGGGIGNSIVGTFVLVLIAGIIGIPVGIFAAIYLSEYNQKGAFSNIIRFIVDIMLGIPSIVVGIFAYLVFVKPFKQFSAISGGLALAIILIPIVIRSAEGVLKLIPDSIREGAYALGISKRKAIIKIVIPTAMKGIVTGVMLAVARVAGETAPLMLTAFGSHYWTSNINEPIASLPAQIFEYAKSPYEDWIQKAWGAALILIIIVLLLNIFARVITRNKFD